MSVFKEKVLLITGETGLSTQISQILSLCAHLSKFYSQKQTLN